MNQRTALCLFLLLLMARVPVRAQDGDVLAWRAAVTQLRDTSELRRLEREQARSETAGHQLAAGFAALQLWRVTGRRQHAERARRYFDRAAREDPASAWAHYGRALSFEPEIGADSGRLVVDDVFGRALGIDPRSRARRALERAVALDPALPGAAELLARYAADTRDASAFQLARQGLADAARAPGAGADVLLALARTAREAGDYQGAADAAARVVQRADSTFARGSLELARALASLDQRRADAAGAYLGALAGADAALLTQLWDDVALIRQAADDSLWQRAGSTEARRAALRSFWQLRGALADRSAGERAAEHYARLNYAWLHHRRWGQFGAAPPNAYRWEKIDPVYADRGIIYIRHGEPDFIWQSGLGDYVVWFYRDQDGGPLSYHFIRYGGNAGWSKDPVLVRRLPCVEPEVALHDPRLRPLTYSCNLMNTEAVSALVRRDVGRALRTDTDAPRFAHEIPFHYDLYTFRGPGGSTELVAGIGVPLARIPADDTPLQLSLALVDTARYTAATAGTAVSVPADRPARDALLRASLAVRATPAPAAAYRVSVRDARSAAGMTYGGTLSVPDYSGRALQLSDIVLAEPDSSGSFVRGPHRLALAPTQVFPGGRFRVFYEVYNLPAGTPYRTEIRIRPARRGVFARLFGRGDPVGLRFEEVAPESVGATHYQLRDVSAPLGAGEYIMHVRIRTGALAVERTRRFTVPEG